MLNLVRIKSKINFFSFFLYLTNKYGGAAYNKKYEYKKLIFFNS